MFSNWPYGYLDGISTLFGRYSQRKRTGVDHQSTCPDCGRTLVNIYERDNVWKCKRCWDKASTILGDDKVQTSHSRGHKIYFDGKDWRYMDTKDIINDDRPCTRCGRPPTSEGHDACLGH